MEREQRLTTLIDAVRQHPKGSIRWRRAIHQLILEIQQLPGLVRSSHPDYYQALDDTFLRLADEIQDFEPKYSSIEKSLVVWINGKLRLKYAVRELYPKKSQGVPAQTAKTEFRQQGKKPPLSLDKPLGEASNETFGDRLATPSLWELQAQIDRDRQQQKNANIGLQLKHYIEQDPQGLLKNCYPNAHPHCNCYILSQRLLLKVPPDKLVTIAREFEINYNTLNWHWKNKGLPLLQSIALDFGYQATES